MLYNQMERPQTHPARVVERGVRHRRSAREREEQGEPISFSVDYLPGVRDEARGNTDPVFMADRYAQPAPKSWSQPVVLPQSPLDLDTGRVERPRLFTGEGVNLRLGVGALLAAGVLMMAVAAMAVGKTSTLNRQANDARERAARLQAQCVVVEQQIADDASELNITTSAVELGMVSSRGVDVIYLEVPEAAAYSNPGARASYGD